MNRENDRSVNILICIAGVLCCIGSGFVAAPQGLLADDSVNLIRAMDTSYSLIFFALPAALMVLVCILVTAGKMDILSLISVLIGGGLFAMMDFQYGVSHRTFSGILVNMIGVILVAAAVLLQVFATQTGPAKVSRKAAKSRNPKEFRYERSRRPSYDDIYFDASKLGRIVSESNDKDMSEVDEYLALDALKEASEEEAAAAAQKEQEDEIEALLAALDADNEVLTVPAAEENDASAVKTDNDAEIEELLKEIQEETDKTAYDTEGILDSDIQLAASAAAITHMAEALETPNQTMTDFYEGIEEIFLNQDNR